jgi:SLOG-like protein
MIISQLDVSLEGFEIGLSGAIPDRSEWEEPAEDRAILEFISLLSALVFKYRGRIIHGAHPTFTPVILRQAELQAMDRDRPPITLVMSELWAKDLDKFERDQYERITEFITVPQVGEGGPEDEEVRNNSLTAMRRQLVQKMNVMVAVGGKQHSSDELIPGVAEELYLAKQRGMPCFLVGGLGGMAGRLAREREGYATELDNDLPVELNRELLTTKDIGACVSIIFDHIASNSDLARRNLKDIDERSAA